jgi:hypothetical protein
MQGKGEAMKRTILALAIAGLSVAAYASPPPGGGPPTPIDVTVTNVPLPVTEVPEYTMPDRLFFGGVGAAIADGGGGANVPLTQNDEDTVLQAYDVQAHVEESATTTCTVNSEIYENDGTQSGRFVTGLGRIVALPGRDAALSIRLPNVYIAVDSNLYLKLSVTASAGGLCHFDAQMRGIKVP